MEKLRFYFVDKNYISYLKRFENKIPNISYDKHDKFVCGVLFRLNGMDYYAPVSSFAKQQRTNILIKNRAGRITSSIRLSFMFPVPANMVVRMDFSKEDLVYRRLLLEEVKYCNDHAPAILRKARYIYASVVEKRDPLMIRNCCNFSLLEDACQQYQQQAGLAPGQDVSSNRQPGSGSSLCLYPEDELEP